MACPIIEDESLFWTCRKTSPDGSGGESKQFSSSPDSRANVETQKNYIVFEFEYLRRRMRSF